MTTSQFRAGLGAFIIGAATIATTGPVSAGEAMKRAAAVKVTDATAIKRPAKNEMAHVFVRFESPSVAETVLNAQRAGLPAPEGSMQRAHSRQIDSEHQLYRNQLQSLGAEVLSSLRVGANGMRIRVPAQRIAEIRSMPGVISVAPVTLHTPDLARSVGWIGAPEVWENVGDGEGVTIAIIDTGIDYLHANLGGAGDADEYANNDFNVIEAGTFPTAKVIGGHDFAGANYDAGSDDPLVNTPQPDADPLDGNGHGSHVAGIAAGLGVDGEIGPGVAKGASLYALKVFGDVGGSTSLTADAIEWALDPNGDGDISDHVDVINMSLGSSFGTPDDASAIAASNAADLGVIVVASAGNSADVPYITGAPGVGANVISVAASATGGDVPAISVSGAPADGNYEAVEGVGAVRVSDGAISGNLVVAEPLVACSADADGLPLGLDNDIAGGIALVSRGSCSFDLKYLNAQMSGASAIIVHNDGASPSRIAPITMGGVGNLGIPVEIPGVMISSLAGEFLNASIGDGAVLAATLDESLVTATLFSDTMASFTSRGPGHGGSGFKPDLSAPGVSTVSTNAGSGNGAAALSGTSMAAPHVAGAGALLHTVFPDASPAAIKALLQNSTVDGQQDGLGAGPIVPLARQGVGVVRVNAAASLTSYASPGGLSFGRINSKKSEKVKRDVHVTNMSDSDRTYAITHVPHTVMDGVTVTAPGSITVKAGKTKKFKVEMEVDPELGPADNASFSQAEADGWFVLDDGVDTLRVGYLAAIDPASDISVKGKKDKVELENKGPGMGWAEAFTLSTNHGGDLNNTSNAIDAIGYRSNVLSGFDVIELGVATERPWESMSNLTFEFYLDTDADGVDDVLLVASDYSDYNGTIGTIITAQFDLIGGGSFLDWFVGVGDYNDETAAFPFTRVSGGGLVPDSFSYRLELTGRDGSVDTMHGDVDFADEVIAETVTVALEADEEVDVATSGKGKMLWLMQNNEVKKQAKTTKVK